MANTNKNLTVILIATLGAFGSCIFACCLTGIIANFVAPQRDSDEWKQKDNSYSATDQGKDIARQEFLNYLRRRYRTGSEYARIGGPWPSVDTESLGEHRYAVSGSLRLHLSVAPGAAPSEYRYEGIIRQVGSSEWVCESMDFKLSPE